MALVELAEGLACHDELVACEALTEADAARPWADPWLVGDSSNEPGSSGQPLSARASPIVSSFDQQLGSIFDGAAGLLSRLLRAQARGASAHSRAACGQAIASLTKTCQRLIADATAVCLPGQPSGPARIGVERGAARGALLLGASYTSRSSLGCSAYLAAGRVGREGAAAGEHQSSSRTRARDYSARSGAADAPSRELTEACNALWDAGMGVLRLWAEFVAERHGGAYDAALEADETIVATVAPAHWECVDEAAKLLLPAQPSSYLLAALTGTATEARRVAGTSLEREAVQLLAFALRGRIAHALLPYRVDAEASAAMGTVSPSQNGSAQQQLTRGHCSC